MENKNVNAAGVKTYERMNEVLCEKIPLVEFYGGIVAASLNDISRACCINFGDIKDIDIVDETQNREAMGLLCDAVVTIEFNNPNSNVTVRVHRSNSNRYIIDSTRTYNVQGSSDGVSFDIEIKHAGFNGVNDNHGVDYDISVSKAGFTYRIRSANGKTKHVVSRNREGSDVPETCRYESAMLSYDQVAAKISGFIQNPRQEFNAASGMTLISGITTNYQRGHGKRI